MSNMRRTFALLLALSFASLAAAQSFDCKLAQSPREKIVCSDTRLSALDAEIAANYKALRAQLSPESAALVMADQQEWLHWLDLVCPANGKGAAANQTQCLQNLYFTRAHDFPHTAHIGSSVIFCRSHFLYKAGAAGNNPISPGFGYGSLRWPQIDIKPGKPNAAYTTWNNAAKTRAGQLAIGFSNTPNATFDTAVDASGIIDALRPIPSAVADGPATQQVQRELAAEEARLQAEHAAQVAKLVAAFGPKLRAATIADEGVAASVSKHNSTI